MLDILHFQRSFQQYDLQYRYRYFVIFSSIAIGLAGSIQRTPPSRLKDASTAVLPGFVSLPESMTGSLKHKGLPPPDALPDSVRVAVVARAVLLAACILAPAVRAFWRAAVWAAAGDVPPDAGSAWVLV